MSFVETYLRLIIKPKEFFQNDAKNQNLIHSSITLFSIMFVLFLLQQTLVPEALINGIRFNIFLESIAYLVLYIAGILLFSGFLHLFLRLFGAKEGVFNTYRAIIFVGMLQSLFFLGSLLAKYALESEKSFLTGGIFMIGLSVLILTGLIYLFYVFLIGISELQKITKMQVFMAFIISSFIILIVFVVIFIILFITLINKYSIPLSDFGLF